MKFSENEIEMAQKLHELGLPWQPKSGDYVYDIKGIIEKASPFQEGVYFILDIKHFIRRAESIEGIKESMCRLPLWEDCREILKDLGVGWEEISVILEEKSAFDKGIERRVLYDIIHEKL